MDYPQHHIINYIKNVIKSQPPIKKINLFKLTLSLNRSKISTQTQKKNIQLLLTTLPSYTLTHSMIYNQSTRPRRLRSTQAVRNLVQERHLNSSHLISPLFLSAGTNKKNQIPSLPVAYTYSIDKMLDEIHLQTQLGIHNFIIFPKIPQKLKNKNATYSYSAQNFYLKAANTIKAQFPDITLISDVAMDPYSSDGHDGLVHNGTIVNDATLAILGKMALAQAEAGFDILGPSDMMDGRVGYMRQQLDIAGHTNVGIMSYTAKYASAFYGPFRDALDSAPTQDPNIPKNKKSYQLNPANSRSAMLEAYLDQKEGADFLMVKPAIHYLDIISQLKSNSLLPIAAYHVSGECAMLIAACKNRWLEYHQVMPESLTSIYRAGADAIISYFAKDFARWQKGEKISIESL